MVFDNFLNIMQIIGNLFDINIETEDYVLKLREKYLAMAMEGKILTTWASEGNSSTKTIVLPVDYILSETRIFLKQKNPAKYGYISTSSSQIRH